jgi:hypothetical protein
VTAETNDLIAAFTRTLANAGCPNPGPLAQELAVIAQGHGWRPSPALTDRPGEARPATPEQAHAYAEDIRTQLRGGT